MRLLFVHGRGQGSSNGDDLKKTWTEALENGCDKAFTELPKSLDIQVAYYGKILDEATESVRGTARTRGPEDPFDSFEAGLLLEIADRAGITEEEISAELALDHQAVARGVQDSRWVQGAGRVLAKRFPFISDEFIRQFFPDVHAYLLWKGVREKINQVVATALGVGPTVVV
ncbi:hypothetical protein AB0G57_21090, partial [Streptomyces lavendulae]